MARSIHPYPYTEPLTDYATRLRSVATTTLHRSEKMRALEEGGSRIGIVLNGTPLFTGAAGNGKSERIVDTDDFGYTTVTANHPLCDERGNPVTDKKGTREHVPSSRTRRIFL